MGKVWHQKGLKRYLFILLLVTICSSTPFSPIQAGTFYITASDLKGMGHKTTKEVDLKTKWEIFSQNLNIGVICVISSINIDQRVGMEFNYSLTDRQDSSISSGKRKVLVVDIFDKKGFVYDEFKLGINYLIAQNLRSDNYNMTDFQEHLMDQSLSEEEMDQSNKEVHSELFLFPNGFSSFNLTHHIMYNYIAETYDMYTIHYMTGEGEHNQQGWNREKDFINFRYLLFPKYQFGYKTCGAVYETQLNDDFYFNCDKKGIDGYFFGLMGAGGRNFAGQFSMSRNGFAFHVNKIDEGHKYNVLAVPYKINNKFEFIDNREHDYDYVEQQDFLVYLIIAVVLLLMIASIIAYIKRKKMVYFDLQEEKITRASQSTKNQKSNDKGADEKNSDEQMKEKEGVKYEEFTSDDLGNKNENFTIE